MEKSVLFPGLVRLLLLAGQRLSSGFLSQILALGFVGRGSKLSGRNEWVMQTARRRFGILTIAAALIRPR